MDYSFYSSAMTVLMLLIFLGIIAWASSSRRTAAFEEAARVPFEEDAIPEDRGPREQS